MTTAFVTGATGFLGGALVRRLSADGIHVKALARRPNRDGYIRDLKGVEVVMGDITNSEGLREVMAGCDMVFHVAAATGGTMSLQSATNITGTTTVMQAAADVQVKRIVHVSTIAVYGYRVQGNVTEETDFDPRAADPYHATKIEAEKVVRAIGERHGLAYSVIRPGMIYGPHSNFWTTLFFKIARRKPTIWLGDGSGSSHPIYVDDVVDMMCVLAKHPSAVGEVFNCTPDPSPTFRDFLGAYAQLFGHDRWLAIPPTIIRPIAALAGYFAPEHSQLKDLPQLLSFIQNRTTYSMAKARERLNWQPEVSLLDGIQRCEPFLREKGLL